MKRKIRGMVGAWMGILLARIFQRRHVSAGGGPDNTEPGVGIFE